MMAHLCQISQNPPAGGLTAGSIQNKIINSTGFLQIPSLLGEVAR
jgi:hypothetical protein